MRSTTVLLLLFWLSLSIQGRILAQDQPPEIPTGLLLIDPATYQSIPLASTPLMGEVPPSADLSTSFPIPGDQGRQSSCVGWAVAYALKSYQETVERSWLPNSPDRLFSPAFIYNQIRRSADCKGGTSYVDALNLVRRDGVASLADFPYSEGTCAATPDAAVRQRAKVFAVADWRRVNVQDETEMKNHIASGFPVLVGMIVDRAFYNLRGPTVYLQHSGENLGGHAVVVVGYDDSRQAFRLINSWGPVWGDNGYGWISYIAFRQAVREGYVVQDIVTVRPGPGPGPTPGPPPPAQLPAVAVGIPQVQHNVVVTHPSGTLPPANGMRIRLPGTAANAGGKTLQLVVRFAFPNGTPLLANPVETLLRDVQGLVATGTPPIPISSPSVSLDGFDMTIPYFALNLQPSNGLMTYPLTMTVTVYLDNFVVAQSQPLPFTVRW